jgi:hypothetical protein
MTKQNKMPDEVKVGIYSGNESTNHYMIDDISGEEYIKKSIHDEVVKENKQLIYRIVCYRLAELNNSIPVDKIEALIEDCEKEIEANYNPKAFGYDFVDDLRIYEKYFKELQTLLPKKEGE